MTDQWEQISRLYHAALKLPESERGAYLKKHASGEEVHREVESLLAHDRTGEQLLKSPALEVAAKMMAEQNTILKIGQILDHYQITGRIGKGGMGEVYQARDRNLGRDVAIKVLPEEFAVNPDRADRFRREAKVLAALNHPNIVTIHEINRSDGVEFIVMEYVEGRTLNRLIDAPGLPIEKVLEYAVQITSALGAAHAAGIVHRDLKPANIMVTDKGSVKVLDFGLSRLTGNTDEDSSAATRTAPDLTRQGVVLGTAAYMSPEQAEGKPVDARSDVFSFGSILFEMLTGRRAFQGESFISTVSSILRDTPAQVRKMRGDAPAPLEKIVNRCLEKDREARYETGAEIWKVVTAVQSRLSIRRMGFGQILRKPQFAIPVLTLLVVIAAMIGWYRIHSSRVFRARTVTLPEIARLVDAQQSCAAFMLMKQEERYLQGDPEFERLWQNATVTKSIHTNPPGADFYMRDFTGDNPEWMYLGRTPLESVTIPFPSDTTRFVYRVTKPGFDEREGTLAFEGSARMSAALFLDPLIPEEAAEPGMIRVPEQPAGIPLTVIQTTALRDVGLQEYWLDKHEVTNRQFKEFIDQGGYEKREYWKYPFMNEGKSVPFEDAMARFTDTTGKQGPATWEYGTYPPDQADYPVGGVSWYEAAAYAVFSGKSLPTIHHWAGATGYEGGTMPILQESNFSGKGPAAVGSYKGLGPYGTYDMAGNVREWCLNASGNDRFIMGGAWNTPSYAYIITDYSPPMDRSAANGIRCAKYTNLPDSVTGDVQFIGTDRRGDKPVSDEIFQVYKRLHEYGHGDLKPMIEASDDSSTYWRLEKVSFQAAYGNERVTALLYLPKNTAPPYQAVVHMGGMNDISAGSSENMKTSIFDFMIRSGRAVMYPIYKGTFERSYDGALADLTKNITLAIDIAKDLGRSLDYLETRQDIDREKLAYLGMSWGACEGPRLLALEPHLKAGVLLSGGAYPRGWPAEVNPFNFAPHTRTPILMVNGRYDTSFTVDGSLMPLFEAIGTPEKDKQCVILVAGHGVINQEVIRLSLEWLDRYLGPVRTR